MRQPKLLAKGRKKPTSRTPLGHEDSTLGTFRFRMTSVLDWVIAGMLPGAGLRAFRWGRATGLRWRQTGCPTMAVDLFIHNAPPTGSTGSTMADLLTSVLSTGERAATDLLAGVDHHL